MPVYVAKFESCDCVPVPDLVFRAENMVSAVMLCQEQLDLLLTKAEKLDLHHEIRIDAIEQMGFELMDAAGIESIVEFWKELAKV